MRKRNYRAERAKAARYADEVMNGEPGDGLSTRRFCELWDLVYLAYLRGLRAALPQEANRAEKG